VLEDEPAIDASATDALATDAPPPTAVDARVLENILDQFGELFGQPSASRARSLDLRYDLEITADDAAYGCKRDIAYSRTRCCGTCAGSGAQAGSGRELCSDCAGTGNVERAHGLFMVKSACVECSGRGSWPSRPCNECVAGRITVSETVIVEIPPGVEHENTLRIANKGDENAAGERGDLYVVITILGEEVRRHRKGDDVEMKVSLDARQYLLGGSIEVATIAGPTRVKIPWLARDGATITLPGLGFSKTLSEGVYRGEVGRGEHRVILQVSAETRTGAYTLGACFAAVVGLLVMLAIL
jgi:molecular chaperone DnaJ